MFSRLLNAFKLTRAEKFHNRRIHTKTVKLELDFMYRYTVDYSKLQNNYTIYRELVKASRKRHPITVGEYSGELLINAQGRQKVASFKYEHEAQAACTDLINAEILDKDKESDKEPIINIK